MGRNTFVFAARLALRRSKPVSIGFFRDFDGRVTRNKHYDTTYIVH